MRILLTNDDGFHAQGLQALATALRQRGDTVWIVAPNSNRSATSCSLTVTRPIALAAHGDTDFALDGSPADCIHVALTGLASVAHFDVVLSGMNDGANLGDDAIHSGTLGAATQAYIYGLPALACSLIDRGWQHLDTAVQCTLIALDALYAQSQVQQAQHNQPQQLQQLQQLQQPIPSLLWNLNIPNVPYVPKIVPAFVGRRTPSHAVQTLLSPRGETFFWLGQGGDVLPEPSNDMAITAAGQASLSPITLDRTDYASLSELRHIFN